MIREFENIRDITFDEFYDRELNESFHAHNEDAILMSDDGRVGFEIKVSCTDENAGRPMVYTLFAETFGDALEKYDVIVGTAIMNITTRFFEPAISPVIAAFFREYRMKMTAEKQNDQDEKCDIYYQKVFQNAKSVEEIVESFSKFEENTTE